MPEVSEIALTAEILEKKIRNKKIVSFDFVSGRYGPGRTEPVGFEDFAGALDVKPMKLLNVMTKGKFLWFVFKGTEEFYVMNTFGLTGMWSLFKARNTRAVLTFADGTEVFYSDPRNFGTFKFTSDRKVLQKKLNELAPDWLKEQTQNLSKIKSVNKNIVEILTDQKLIGSGIGNYLVCEILYRAKLSPRWKGPSLSTSDVKNLVHWIQYMVKLSYVSNHIGYMVNLDEEAVKLKRKDYLPDIKLKKSDEEFEFSVYRKKIDPLGNPVRIEKIKDRSIHWVKAVQK